MAEHNKLGEKAENIAAEYLANKGYKIRHRNWYDQHREIDIIAVKDEILVIVEVKSRFGDEWERPQDAISLRKQRFIVQAADMYIQTYDLDMEVRFDVISIIFYGKTHKIEHIEDAFYPLINS